MTTKRLDYSGYAPRVGDAVTYRSLMVGVPDAQGVVTATQGDVAEVDYGDGRDPAHAAFIWRFANGLNPIHDWPAKVKEHEAPLPRSTLLCQPMYMWPDSWQRDVRIVDEKIVTARKVAEEEYCAAIAAGAQ